MAGIKFGTDGWRGIIAEDFTFANVRIVAEAVARYVVRGEDARKGVIVGYDHRYASDAVARRITQNHAGPFCTMKMRSARGFVATECRPPGLRPDEASRALSSKTTRTKRRNEAYPPDSERFRLTERPLRDWPV